MQDTIKNISTAITLVVVIFLPLYTFLDSWKLDESKRQFLVKYQGSVLELPIITDSYNQKQLYKLENMNKEMSGLITVYSIPLQTQILQHDTN